MKKLFFAIFLLVVILMVGCQDSNYNPISPNNNQQDLQKKGLIGNALGGLVNNLTSTLLSATKIIDGSAGGSLQLVENVLLNGQVVRVRANLIFSKGAITGQQNISMTIDPNNASVTFLPHISSFSNNVKLDLKIEGVDLSKLRLTNPDSIYFAYINDAGIPVEEINCSAVGANEKTGTLYVYGADLKHFSRYVWATRK
jgi:hypothetical protein